MVWSARVIALRIRKVPQSEAIEGVEYLYLGNADAVSRAVLEFFGEVPKALDEDGPTLTDWQPVPMVDA